MKHTLNDKQLKRIHQIARAAIRILGKRQDRLAAALAMCRRMEGRRL